MIRVFVLVIVTAVLANANCYNACATAVSHPAQSSPDSCHHHHQSPPTGGVCQHQHASVTSPENLTGLSKQHAAASSSLIAILAPQKLSVSQLASDAALVFQDRGPPGRTDRAKLYHPPHLVSRPAHRFSSSAAHRRTRRREVNDQQVSRGKGHEWPKEFFQEYF